MQAAVGRASVVVHSRATTGTQPFPSVVKDVCRGAQMAVATAQRSRGSRAVLTSVNSVLATIIGSANATLTANCVAAATVLGDEESRLAEMIRADLVAFWDRSRVRIPDVRFLAREIAVMLLSHNRHVSGVRLSMERALRRTGGSGAELAALLFRDPERFRVACTVDGTNRLEHLRELKADALQFDLDDSDPTGWGFLNGRLGAYIATMRETRPGGPHARPGCVVSVIATAVDPEAAAALGRREVSELLDHYVAGHRLVDLSLRRDVLIGGLTGRSSQWHTSSGAGVESAHPLSVSWPTVLNETMRMSHIARATDSPLTAAALSWSALEASRLEPLPLAGALALQALRHGLVQSHHELVAGLTAATNARKMESEEASRRANALRVSLRDFDGPAAARGDLAARSRAANAREKGCSPTRVSSS